MQWFDFTNVDTLLAGTFDQFRLRKLINQLTLGKFLGSVPNVVFTGKCLVSGISVTAVIANGVCTVTHNAHGYSVGDILVFTGTAVAGTFAGVYVITSVTTNTYTFFTSATGTVTSPVETFWFSGIRSIGTNLISNIVRSGSAVYTFTFKNTQSNGFYGIVGTMGNSGNQAGFNVTQSVSPSTTAFSVNGINSGGNVDADTYFYIALTGIN